MLMLDVSESGVRTTAALAVVADNGGDAGVLEVVIFAVFCC